MNWTCNCSLYNTLVLVVYIILLSERGSERWSRGVRWDYLAFLAHVGRGAFGNANVVRNVGCGTFGNANAVWNAGRSVTRMRFGTLVVGRSATRTLDVIRGNKQCSGRI